MVEAAAFDASVRDRTRVRILVRYSLGAAVLAFALAVVMNLGLYLNDDILPGEIKGPRPLAGVIGATSLCLGLLVTLCAMGLNSLGMLLGLFRAPRLMNLTVAAGGLLLSLLASTFLTGGFTRARAHPARFHARAVASLAAVIQRYAAEHDGHLPPSANWCEALASFDPNAARYLAYSLTGESAGSSTLGLNVNLDGRRLSELPNCVVLLFGTRLASNPVGDHSLLAAEQYDGKGTIILFGDLHIEFVKTSGLGKLRWRL